MPPLARHRPATPRGARPPGAGAGWPPPAACSAGRAVAWCGWDAPGEPLRNPGCSRRRAPCRPASPRRRAPATHPSLSSHHSDDPPPRPQRGEQQPNEMAQVSPLQTQRAGSPRRVSRVVDAVAVSPVKVGAAGARLRARVLARRLTRRPPTGFIPKVHLRRAAPVGDPEFQPGLDAAAGPLQCRILDRAAAVRGCVARRRLDSTGSSPLTHGRCGPRAAPRFGARRRRSASAWRGTAPWSSAPGRLAPAPMTCRPRSAPRGGPSPPTTKSATARRTPLAGCVATLCPLSCSPDREHNHTRASSRRAAPGRGGARQAAVRRPKARTQVRCFRPLAPCDRLALTLSPCSLCGWRGLWQRCICSPPPSGSSPSPATSRCPCGPSASPSGPAWRAPRPGNPASRRTATT